MFQYGYLFLNRNVGSGTSSVKTIAGIFYGDSFFLNIKLNKHPRAVRILKKDFFKMLL